MTENEKILGTVRFNGAFEEQIRWGGNDDPNPLLHKGSIYDVVEIEVHTSHTKIRLHGVEGWFNDASFDWLDETPKQEALAEWLKNRRYL